VGLPRSEAMATIYRQDSDHQPADVLVVFGISGDLAR
jgi:hypothetical protein